MYIGRVVAMRWKAINKCVLAYVAVDETWLHHQDPETKAYNTDLYGQAMMHLTSESQSNHISCQYNTNPHIMFQVSYHWLSCRYIPQYIFHKTYQHCVPDHEQLYQSNGSYFEKELQPRYIMFIIY